MMQGEIRRDGSIIITKQMEQAATAGLGHCLRCRSMLEDAAMLGFDMPAVRNQIDEWQPKLEGVIAYAAAMKGNGNA